MVIDVRDAVFLLVLAAAGCGGAGAPPAVTPSPAPERPGEGTEIVVRPATPEPGAGREPGKPRTVSMVKLVRGGLHPLDGTAAVRFVGHSHKMAAVGGPSSPLIVYLEYLEAGQVVEQQQFNVFPAQSREWTWRGYRFTLGDYAYGEWMELHIVPLESRDPGR